MKRNGQFVAGIPALFIILAIFTSCGLGSTVPVYTTIGDRRA